MDEQYLTYLVKKIKEFLAIEFNEYQDVVSFINKIGKDSFECCQFLGCLAIDVKGKLVDKKSYAVLISEFVSSEYFQSLAENEYASLYIFDQFLEDRIILSNDAFPLEGSEYVRVLTEEVFVKYYSSTDGYPYHNLNHYTIDWKKIKSDGWSGKKKIVWITPYKEFKLVLNQGDEFEAATRVCDYLGFPRDETVANAGSPIKNKGKTVYIYIKYPSSFNEKGYQPNTTNADWRSFPSHFISYPKEDGFGRTYCEKYPPPAKEIIHCKSTFVDKGFSIYKLGVPSTSNISYAAFLQEIERRFDNAK